MTPVFLQIGLGFSPFHAGLMMIPMVLGSMGMKRIVVQVVNHFGYRRVLVATTLGLSLVTLLFMTTALLGWYYVLPFVLFLQGMVNSTRFSSMNTLTLKDLPDNLASSGNSLLSMIMQLSMSIGVTIAGLLLGLFGSQHVSVDSGTTKPSLCTPGLAWRLSSPFRRSSLPECQTIRIKTWLFRVEKGARNEVLAARYYRQTVSGDFRHLHCLADQYALGGAYQF